MRAVRKMDVIDYIEAAGAYQPDNGRLIIGGKAVHFAHPVEALRVGISVIYPTTSEFRYRGIIGKA